MTIASGEVRLGPERGIGPRQRKVRLGADSNSFPISEHDSGMLLNSSDCRSGADPPRNESGIQVPGSFLTIDTIFKSISDGKGFLIADNIFNNDIAYASTWMAHTRSCCSSAAMTIVTRVCIRLKSRMRMEMGSSGQTSSASLTGLVSVQRSRRRKGRGEANTRHRHRRHTCTSACHASSLSR